MSEKRRRWFQIHLSTAVVLMFVAGLMILLNVSPRISDEWAAFESEGGGFHIMAYGFPMVVFSEVASAATKGVSISAWSPLNVVVNVFVMLGIVFMTAFFLEQFIRRREARKL